MPHHVRSVVAGVAVFLVASHAADAATKDTYQLLQSPALRGELIAFGYAGDLWTVPRIGGRATRLTAGVGLESSPQISPDGSRIAFTGEYDGNTDVFTIPSGGGIPKRITYHPGADIAVGWSPDGKRIIFRSARESASRYTQLFSIAAQGGEAVRLPLPMAYQGALSPDGTRIAYSPLAPAFGFDFTSFVSWGNYRGGRAGTIRITTLAGLDSTEIPHEQAADFSPVYSGGDIFFLSARAGHTGIFRYNPASNAVSEVLHNNGADIRSLAADGATLIYDQLGKIFLFDTASGTSREVPIEIAADLPEVRPSIKNVAAEIEHAAVSPSGVRVAFEAHGEILTVPVEHGPVRDITRTPGVMERSPAWSPDGQSIAYFSDESGAYALHIAAQRGAATSGPEAVRKFSLGEEPAYYFSPKWSPDGKHIAFYDNRLKMFVLDVASGKLSVITDKNVFGGFSEPDFDMAWSPDSRWIAYPRSMENHLHALFLYSLESGVSTRVSGSLGDARLPAFDRNGRYLYYAVSTNAGASSDTLDMSSDLYQVRSVLYAAVLAADQPSPLAPELDDEKPVAMRQGKTDGEAKRRAGNAMPAATEKPSAGSESGKAAAAIPVPATRIDLAGLETRALALPLPPAAYTALVAGRSGSLYFLVRPEGGRYDDRAATLNRFTLEDRKSEKLAERVEYVEIDADGDKMLLALSTRKPAAPPDGAEESKPNWVVVAANAPLKAGEGVVATTGLQVRVDPAAEWQQMYHEVWRIERAYFYDPNFHGVPMLAEERRYLPYVKAVASRADLNYIFQDMLGEFSVGHLRGGGGAIPRARRVAGGLLGADYVIRDNRYCVAKVYTGGEFNPQDKAPLAQPGLNVKPGDCILAIDGQDLDATTDIQQLLEGTAEQAVTLLIAPAGGGKTREFTVVPVASEAALRHTDWVEANLRKVEQLSGGKLAYVYLTNTGAEGFADFNRYYFAQTNKQGAIIDERFNAGGQMADYIAEVLSRHIEAYWAPRYGRVEHTPNAGIYGPKVMIANEISGSGGDALPWLFKQGKIGTLVGKRTWGGLVGINDIPALMDGGRVTSPSVAFFSPRGEWDVENHGVDPDVTVEQDPKAVSEGHDPQLEAAVTIALKELATHPPLEPAKPSYPNYHR